MLPDTTDPLQRFMDFLRHKKMVEDYGARSWCFSTFCSIWNSDEGSGPERFLAHPSEETVSRIMLSDQIGGL